MEIQNFRNDEFGSLRVIQNEKGEMMFCLADVCKALAIGNSSQMKTRLDGDDLISSEVVTKTSNQHGECSKRYKMTFIGEPNLYRCIFQSKKDSAKRFQDWVFGEVPPLTQSQINHCMEQVLVKHFGKGGAGMCTKWDILNAMTDTLKPLNNSEGLRVPICDTSRLLPQLARCAEYLL